MKLGRVRRLRRRGLLGGEKWAEGHLSLVRDEKALRADEAFVLLVYSEDIVALPKARFRLIDVAASIRFGFGCLATYGSPPALPGPRWNQRPPLSARKASLSSVFSFSPAASYPLSDHRRSLSPSSSDSSAASVASLSPDLQSGLLALRVPGSAAPNSRPPTLWFHIPEPDELALWRRLLAATLHSIGVDPPPLSTVFLRGQPELSSQSELAAAEEEADCDTAAWLGFWDQLFTP